MTRQPISEVAARHLEQWLDKLMRGDLHLGDLPLTVEAFFHAGYAAGLQYAVQQAREYEHRLDLAYLAAYSPKDRAAEYQRRLDHHFAQQDEQFFSVPLEQGTAVKEAA